MKTFFVLGCVNAFISVSFGAFGAHMLRSKISDLMMITWEKGVDYQMYHALALIVVALCIKQWPDVRRVRTAGFLLLMGIVLFSGSLYALVLTQIKGLGMITPIGGITFLWGWILLAMCVRDFDNRY
ncbi:MAG: DUF423 domain-containing protein [Desulfuromonas sp.]|nr:DUF423 domain-containing protein [Desulfuromonas sp.]